MIPTDYILLKDTEEFLKKEGIELCYRGLRTYIDKGLIPKPIKVLDRKEKMYHKGHLLMSLKYIRLKNLIRDAYLLDCKVGKEYYED